MRRTLFLVRTLAVLSVGAMMIVPMWPARATVERIEIACTDYFLSLDLSGATDWMAGNVWHGRGGQETVRTEGSPYCEGKEIVVGSVNLNDEWVEEDWGTFRYELDAFPGSGFEGSWRCASSGPCEEVGTGYGALEGWQIRTSLEVLEPEKRKDPYALVWGYVFNPGG